MKYTAALLTHLALLMTACGGSPVKGLDVKAGFAFEGLKPDGMTFDPATGRYLLTWAHPEPNTGYYFIYRRYDGQNYDYTQPWRVTQNFVERTDDLRFEPRSCFAVRYATELEGRQDDNANEACTTHAQVLFNGIASVTRDENSDYVLRWGAVPIPNVVYSIFTGTVEDRETVSFVKPAWETTDTRLRIDRFELGRRMCFAVRFNGTNPIVDQNTNTLCTDDNLLTDFSGIDAVSSPDISAAQVFWHQSAASFVDGYNIHVYQGSPLREVKVVSVSQRNCSNATCVDGRVYADALVQGLIAGGIYHIGVRARDGGNHEDTNEVLKCVVVQGGGDSVSCPE